MSTPFPGFSPEALKFFRSLARNNHREWFLPRKAFFEEQVKAPMRMMVEALNGDLKRFAPEYVTDPAKAIYRFYRDTRFSKDKSPYKDHIAASFPRRGVPGQSAGAGFYFSVNHKSVGVGGGIYMAPPETIRDVRHHLAEHHQEFRRILRAKPVRDLFQKLDGEQLTRVPKGFAKGHPAEDLLRYKQFLLYVELPAGLATSPELYPTVRKHFQAMTPFLEFLNAPLARKAPPKAGTSDLWQ